MIHDSGLLFSGPPCISRIWAQYSNW